jgi:hypothetical protein
MFYNLSYVMKYGAGVLGAVDCPLAGKDGTFTFNQAPLPSAFLQLDETMFGTVHFDGVNDPLSKLEWIGRCQRLFANLDLARITNVRDVAARCSVALSQIAPANEVDAMPQFGVIITGLSRTPVNEFEIASLHSHRRARPNQPFSQPVFFPVDCLGGNFHNAQFVRSKIFGHYFDRDQSLKMIALLFQISHRALLIQGAIAPDLDVVEVGVGVPYRRVPREEIEAAKRAASSMHQKLTVGCRRLSGAI